uniref:alcohol dehydrogenase catalytic domain-containing protein n=1 Tax=Pseudolysinimonas sp. TaxID=2680009 RepID=UPI00286D009A
MNKSAGTRAVVVHARGDIRVDQIPTPTPAPDEALVAIELGGICGSDLHYWLHGAAGESILHDPLVLGHEVVGRVSSVAADGSGPAAGERVAVHPATEGTYLGSAALRPHQAGAFADLVALPTRMLRPIPDSLDPRAAALIEPLSVAWHAVARAGDVREKRVLVVGAGPIGALIVAVLVHHGVAEVVVTDVFEAPRERALALGATRALAADDSAAIEALDVDIAIESSGSSAGLGAAIRAT